jgi:hypothetical protein
MITNRREAMLSLLAAPLAGVAGDDDELTLAMLDKIRAHLKAVSFDADYVVFPLSSGAIGSYDGLTVIDYDLP